jgi:hypothetical protein
MNYPLVMYCKKGVVAKIELLSKEPSSFQNNTFPVLKIGDNPRNVTEQIHSKLNPFFFIFKYSKCLWD